MPVRTSGEEDFEQKVIRLSEAIQAATVVAAHAGAIPVETAWKRNIRYAFSSSIRYTGMYLRSIHTEVKEVGPGKVLVEIGTDLTEPPYPSYQEFGTSKMKATPTMIPALVQTREKAIRESQEVFQKVIAKAIHR